MSRIYRLGVYASVLSLFLPALTCADGIVVVSTVVPKPSKDAESPEASKGSDAGVARYGITRSDYKRIRETVPTIKRAVPVRTVSLEVTSDTCAAKIRVSGTTPDFASLSAKTLGIHVERGRFLTDNDLKRTATVAIIDSDAAAKLFPNQDPLGQDVTIAKKQFTVAGVFTRKRAIVEKGRIGQVLVPLTTMRRFVGGVVINVVAGKTRAEAVELTEIWLSVEIDDVEPTRAVVENMLQKCHSRNDYSVQVR